MTYGIVREPPEKTQYEPVITVYRHCSRYITPDTRRPRKSNGAPNRYLSTRTRPRYSSHPLFRFSFFPVPQRIVWHCPLSRGQSRSGGRDRDISRCLVCLHDLNDILRQRVPSARPEYAWGRLGRRRFRPQVGQGVARHISFHSCVNNASESVSVERRKSFEQLTVNRARRSKRAKLFDGKMKITNLERRTDGSRKRWK